MNKLICFYTPTNPRDPFACDEPADLIADLLLSAGLLIALSDRLGKSIGERSP
jgi:hypothetical protein